MRKLIPGMIVCLFTGQAFAQELTGYWHSPDKSRVYEIRRLPGNSYSVVINSSSRSKDSIGFPVIRQLEYNARRKRYEGLIYALGDAIPVFVRIRFSRAGTDKINLKLKRMLFLDAEMSWTRAKDVVLQN